MNVPVFSTHGCRLNAYETHAMELLAAQAGVGDAVVVNTCAVTAEAVRKARQDIRRLRNAHPGAMLVVTGCAAQTAPAAFAAMPEVDRVVGNAEKMRPATWATLARGDGQRVQVGDVMAETRADAPPTDGFGTRARAYVQVQAGCDHRCTFCIIPYARGNSRSVPADVVVDRIARLRDGGYDEVVLTGVDLTSWGADLPGAPRFGDLVARVLRATPDLPRLRLSSIDSIEADPALIDAIGGEPRLMPHIHLSLQHGADLILKRMKRRHLRHDAVRFCETVRALRPEVVFGADLIAGFPTETEAQHAENLSLLDACGVTWLHAFPYSPRPGTPAARMPAVDSATIRRRAAELRAAGVARVAAHLDAQIGLDHAVLMESPRLGRTEGFAEVIVPRDLPVGRIARVRIAGRDGRRLLAG
jgi:threonylcarbamoyladenosine tRNA methylthiotransferase MtaB